MFFGSRSLPWPAQEALDTSQDNIWRSPRPQKNGIQKCTWFLWFLIWDQFWNHFGDHFEVKCGPKSAPKMEIKMATENIVVLGPKSGLPPLEIESGRVLFLKMQVLPRRTITSAKIKNGCVSQNLGKQLFLFTVFGVQRPPKSAWGSPRSLPRVTWRTPKPQKKNIPKITLVGTNFRQISC